MNEEEPILPDDLLTLLPYGLAGAIYRSPLPFSPLFDRQGLLLDAFIKHGVDVVVMLTPKSEVKNLTGLDLFTRYQQLGFDVIYAPVQDFSIPQKGAFQEPVKRILRAAKSGLTSVIHCHAGLGRTGMFAACLAKVVFDLDGAEASDWVRQYITRAIETPEQRRFVEEFVYKWD
jgi:protein-tyrosine phosphatase